MKKNKVIGLLAALGCIAVGAGANMVHSAKVTAETADTVLATIAENFNMEYGASVRIGTNNGIRFTATLDETVYGNLEALESTDVQVNYGMLIIPKDKATEVNNPQSVFNAETYHLSNEQTCDCGKKHIAAVQYETISSEKLEHETKDGVMYLRGSLVGIAQSNLTREFVGIGYIEYVANGTPQYYFAAYAKDKGDDDGVADIENNTRSMTYVAQLAIADDKDTDGTLQTNYVDPLAGNQYKYTVQHYLPKDATFKEGLPNWGNMWNGGPENYWAVDKEEERFGVLGTVSDGAAIAAEKDAAYFDCDDYVKLVSYKVVNGTLYANGKTVIKIYYKVEPNVELNTSYDIKDKIVGATKETDSEKGEVYKFIDVRDVVAADGTSQKSQHTAGFDMGLKYSEALAIKSIMYATDTNFTWTIGIKADTSDAGGHQNTTNPELCLANGGLSSISATTSTFDGTTKFAYDTWGTITYAEDTLAGTFMSKDVRTMQYLCGDLKFFKIEKAFSNSKAWTNKINLYISEISFSVTSAQAA